MSSENIDISDVIQGDNEDMMESIESMRKRLSDMRRLMDERSEEDEKVRRRRNVGSGDSIINGNFLSIIFTTILVLIIVVSGYAFVNLYFAILKKFPSKPHTEL